MKEKIKMELAQSIEKLGAVRDSLFEASREVMTSGEGDWRTMEGLIEASKRAEILRRTLKEFMDKGHLPSPPPLAGRISATKRREDYPRYEVRDGAVVRVGLRRNGRTEYEHIVKRPDFDTLIARLNEFVDASEFTVDDVQKGLSLPVYMTYLVISLLGERLEVLEPARRGAYRFREGQRSALDPEEIIARI